MTPKTMVIVHVYVPVPDPRALTARAATLLGRFRRAPGMYAITREAFLSMVCGVMDLACPGFDPRAFYARHLGTRGNLYLGPLRRVRVYDDWARAACDDAFELLMESL